MSMRLYKYNHLKNIYILSAILQSNIFIERVYKFRKINFYNL